MPRGDKSKSIDKQKRQAEPIEEGYEKRGVSDGEVERRARATVNAASGGGEKSGSGQGQGREQGARGKRRRYRRGRFSCAPCGRAIRSREESGAHSQAQAEQEIGAVGLV